MSSDDKNQIKYTKINPLINYLGENLFVNGAFRPVTSFFVKHLGLFSYCFRSQLGLIKKRPHYAYCVLHGAKLAKRLGYERISVIEFGVAGGNGLLSLESHAEKIGREIGIEIEVYGFDTGKGLPPDNDDYRNLPYMWRQGFYQMDFERLKEKLHSAKLIIGDVKETVNDFFENYDPAPIAAVMFDMDYYSSTIAAFKIFEADDKKLLPRIHAYFDDIGAGLGILAAELDGNDYTGVRLAINEFNDAHTLKKICPQYCLATDKFVDDWKHQIFIFHSFMHNDYNKFVDTAANQEHANSLK
jgi:hypothetical protein